MCNLRWNILKPNTCFLYSWELAAVTWFQGIPTSLCNCRIVIPNEAKVYKNNVIEIDCCCFTSKRACIRASFDPYLMSVSVFISSYSLRPWLVYIGGRKRGMNAYIKCSCVIYFWIFFFWIKVWMLYFYSEKENPQK